MVALSSAGRVAWSGRSFGLAVGDAVAILAFVVVGEIQHGGTMASGVTTYAQFLLGWAVAGPLLGAYAPDSLQTRPRAGAVVFLAWVGGALLGQAVRAVVKPGLYVSPAFVAVSIGFGGLALVAWRVVAISLFE